MNPNITMYRRLSHQQGAALVVLLVTMLLAAGALLANNLSADDLHQRAEAYDRQVLAEAKQVLIQEALVHTNSSVFRPGAFICPDITNDGVTNSGAACASYTLGRLPWRSLKGRRFQDSAGEDLWYIVSTAFKNKDSTSPINSSTPTQLSLDGMNDVVALIIAPGAPLGAAQSNRLGAPTDYRQYIESRVDGADPWRYSSHPMQSPVYNDRVIAITRDDLLPALEGLALRTAATALNNYYAAQGHYPWLAPYAQDPDGTEAFVPVTGNRYGRIAYNQLTGAAPNKVTYPLWFVQMGWPKLIYAAIASNYVEDGVGECDASTCLRVVFADSNGSDLARFVLMAPGGALAGQTRTDFRLDSFFEGANQLENDLFTRAPGSAVFNDQLYVNRSGA